jgi:cytochrome c oxidase cbb3-type subunit 3
MERKNQGPWRAAARVSVALVVVVLVLGAIYLANAAETASPIKTPVAGEASPGSKITVTPVSGDFPRPPSDPAAVDRGKGIFSVNCSFCHGSDARGGEGGPNLLRSPIVLNDQKGNLIATVVQTGRVDKGMPKFDLGSDAIADIAAFLHSIPLGRAQGEAIDPKAILVGDPAAGRAYFFGRGRCVQCHALQGQFAHIGSRFDPKSLQDDIVSAGATTLLGAPLPTAPPRTVTVTLRSGEVFSGDLISIDDFSLTVKSPAGRRTFKRDGDDNPRLEIRNPLQAHRDMLRNWNDDDLHNLTAFLAGQK